MTDLLRWKLGVEIELLAPKGQSRQSLALALARSVKGPIKGRVERRFHADAEAAELPGGLFYHLTPAFEVMRGRQMLFRLIDDITIRNDLQFDAPSKPGWYRVLSDDARLIRLAARHCDANAKPDHVLDPLAKLFGGTQGSLDGMYRLVDEVERPLFMVAQLPGERERVCELITSPMERDQQATLEGALAIARRLKFSVPHEGATHFHFDGEKLKSSAALRNLMLFAHSRRAVFRGLFRTNPACVRLGPAPETALYRLAPPSAASMSWANLCEMLSSEKVAKYCDVNVVNILKHTPKKNTVEFRMLPVYLQAEPLIDAAVVFERLLTWATTSKPVTGLEADRPATKEAAIEMFALLRVPAEVGRRLLAASALS